MSLRVLGGEYRGRALAGVRGFGTRPLLAQVREAVFNILGQRMDDQVVWDLFAGTGANGIEALSRGAAHVVFVEKANQALAVLRRNLEELGAQAVARSTVLKRDAWLAPTDLDPELPAPDLIFLDPPYPLVAEDPVRAAYRALELARQLTPDGVLCFHFRDGVLDRDDFGDVMAVDLRTWGTTAMAFVRPAGTAATDEGPGTVKTD